MTTSQRPTLFPCIRPPGFGLPRKQWCTLTRFKANQRHWRLLQALGPGW